MCHQQVHIPEANALTLDQFKEMDYLAVQHYHLPIELLMENAGLQLANLIVSTFLDKHAKILIGVGKGNNGGGGLVAARRLAAWGYDVYLDVLTEINNDLPKRQLERALASGVKTESIDHPDIWIDAYLGFSQQLPLRQRLLNTVVRANNCQCTRISLDIPTGFLGDVTTTYFESHKILSLAAAKKILYLLPASTQIFLADLGIPKEVYEKFGISMPPFDDNNILELLNKK